MQHGVFVQRCQLDAAPPKHRRHGGVHIREKLCHGNIRKIERGVIGRSQRQKLCGKPAQALGFFHNGRGKVAPLLVRDNAFNAQNIRKTQNARQRRFHLVRHGVRKALAAFCNTAQLFLALVDGSGHLVDAVCKRFQLRAALFRHTHGVVARGRRADGLYGAL